MLTRALHLLGCFIMLAAPAGADVVYTVSINTAPLIAHSAGPFALDLQFADGSGTGDANNTVLLSGFAFGTGSPAGSIARIGGVTGDLSSSVQMIDSSFFNEFDENFNPGTTLSFQLRLSTNTDSGAPDEFSLAILDRSGFEIPTLGPGDALLIVDVGSGMANVSTFATDTGQSPTAGGPPIGIAAPQVTPVVSSVPEPSSFLLLSVALCVLVLTKKRVRKRAES